MYDIKKYNYSKASLNEVKKYRFGENWPVVYILEDGREAYIGEAGSAYRRANQHLANSERAKLENFYIIADDEYNKSATLDIESSLIRYMSGDGKFLLQNGNFGIQEADYYDKERYQAKFQIIWKDLKKKNLVKNDLIQIENSDLFKYSPYKALSVDQLSVVEDIFEILKSGGHSSFLVSGEPGTGKTIVATYLMKLFTSKKWSQGMKIGLVIPMIALRKTLKRVFKSVKGLNPGMILGPNDVVKQNYDILIVDEAHRLQRRVNLPNYRDFDRINAILGLEKNGGTQLDWIMMSSKSQILFYDEQQTVKPADIRPKNLEKYNFTKLNLTSQMRVKGGEDYIKYIRDVLNQEQKEKHSFKNYDFRIFDNAKDMFNLIQEKNKKHGLSRLLAGYAWKWQTKGNETVDYDIEIDEVRLKWNSVTEDWVNSPNAVNEVGCIHTIQGYDLNYAGVIIGPEIYYDEKTKKVVVDKKKYLDFNGRRAISDPKELDIYIKNIYKTLLTRGLYGTYVYVVDENLRKYLGRYIKR